MDTSGLIRHAEKAMAGRHPQNGFPINDGDQAAMPYLLLALVKEQQATNQHLSNIAHSLAQIAKALEQTGTAPQQEPKRSLWLPRRRNA